MRITTLLTAPLLMLAVLPAHAGLVGDAANYNVFVFNDFTGSNSDIQGNLAAGGDVNVSNYSVASSITGNPAQSPDPARLVADGSLTATNGGVGSGQNGAVYTHGATMSGFTATGGSFVQNLVNFSNAASQYQSLSTAWSALSANGVSSSLYGTLSLTGANAGLNVFTLNGSTLTNTNTVNINVPSNATVLINVSGSNETFQNGQIFLTGVDPTHVIYNFYNSNSLNLAGSKNPMGSILAPWAAVTGGYGQMFGQLIANSFNGNIEFHNYAFAGTVDGGGSKVPEPAGIWFFALMAAFFTLRGRGQMLVKPEAKARIL